MKAIPNTPGPVWHMAIAYRDERLARSAERGDDHALMGIFSAHGDELHAYSHMLLGNTAEADQALRATREAAAAALEADRRRIALRPWLYRLAHNEAIAIVRRRQMIETPTMYMPRTRSRVPEQTDPRLHKNDLPNDLAQLAHDMRAMGERERGALLMREQAGFSYDEIADAFACTLPAARRAVYGARRALYELDHEEQTDECRPTRHALEERDTGITGALHVRLHLWRCPRCRELRGAIEQRSNRLAWLVRARHETMLNASAGPDGAARVRGG